jgi:hypothetical protein
MHGERSATMSGTAALTASRLNDWLRKLETN